MTTARIEPLEKTIPLNGINLHYLDWGSEGKPPLVILHGFSSQARYWDGFAVKMRDDYHVYCLDQRGHGLSDWADDYGPDAMPNDLLAFADALGLARFTLIGHSMGGMVSLRFAAFHPERIEALVVVDAGIRLLSGAPVAQQYNSVTRALTKDTFASEGELMAHYQAMAPGLDIQRAMPAIMHNFKTLPDGRVTYRFDPSLRQRLIGSSEAERERARVAQAAMESRTGNLKAPVLILRGELSDILSREAADATAAAFPHGRVVEVPGATHMIPSDNPLAFRTAVRDFLGA
jgi:pimeloyl-ACP methyl ester carboxylesterase